MNILVTGANGYVGLHLVSYLVGQGNKIWALVRPSCSEQEKQLLTGLGAILVPNELDGDKPLQIIPEEMDVVVHLLGSLQAPSVGTFRSVHASKTRFLAAECRRLGVRRLVYLGTLGAAPEAVSEYLRTKWFAEEEVRASGVPHVIVRSPLIFGREIGARESKVIAKLKELIQTRKRIPIVGNGRNLLQPIYVGDLVRCLNIASSYPSLENQSVDVGGPERVSFEQLVTLLSEKLGVQKDKAHIPIPLALCVAMIAQCFGLRIPITPDQVRMMKQDVVVDTARMQEIFGPPRVSLREGL